MWIYSYTGDIPCSILRPGQVVGSDIYGDILIESLQIFTINRQDCMMNPSISINGCYWPGFFLNCSRCRYWKPGCDVGEPIAPNRREPPRELLAYWEAMDGNRD